MSTNITPLEGIDNSSRLLRTSIYIRNALNQSDGSVQDMLDCIVPIVESSISNLPHGQIVLPELQVRVTEDFSFKVPTLALEHILGRISSKGKIKYDKDQKQYFHSGIIERRNDTPSLPAQSKINFIEEEISNFARERFGLDEPPYFSNWSDVIVYFLHPDSLEASSVVKKTKDALIADHDDILRRIAAEFFLHCEGRVDRTAIEVVIDIYGGILLGDFLQNIQTTGNEAAFKTLTVIYDTTILLRLLGCSGAEIRLATMEMHRDLQALGCKTEYFDHNESEVATILDTVVGKHDAGVAIFGETGEALLRGDALASVGRLRLLRDSFTEELAKLTIFPSSYSFRNTKTENFFQIDEKSFEDLLSTGGKHGYADRNLTNDTRSMAIIMRLRRQSKSIDLATSKFLFITPNSHFARTARRYVREIENFSVLYVPPVLTHSQISTAAWLSREARLTDSSLSRDLIANCMSAQKVTKEWVDGFTKLIEGLEAETEDATYLYAVRSIARDESLGNPTILRKLNANEMLNNARQAESLRMEEQRSKLEASAREEIEAVRASVERATRLERHEDETQRSDRFASIFIRLVELAGVFLFFVVLVRGVDTFSLWQPSTWLGSIPFLLVTLVAVFDLFGFKPLRRALKPLKSWIGRKIQSLLYGS